MEFGEKLKQARSRAGLTQDAVAQQVGVSRQTVSNWENNRSYPDLASVLKLSDLYDVSLDDMLKEDTGLRRKVEKRQESVKKYSSWLYDFAMLLIGSTIVLAWQEKTAAMIVLGVVGLLLVFLVHAVFVFRLGANPKVMALESVAMALWLSGYLIRIGSNHGMPHGDALWLAGIGMQCYVRYRMDWEIAHPKHMTAFTGFVLAMVLVFGTIPFVGDSIERGDHVESNPFNSRDYRVAEVMTGDREPLPMVYLGSTNSVYLDWPGQEEQKLEGTFTYITQPEGVKTKGVWEMLEGKTLYRVTVEEDDRVTIACIEGGQNQWAYALEPSPKMGCTIRDVLGSVVGSADWYYEGTFDDSELLGSFPLRGKGTVKLSVPGTEETVTVYEEFRDGDTVESQSMVLTKDKHGFVEFQRETRQEGGKQTGIYRIPYQNGEFVLVLNYVK